MESEKPESWLRRLLTKWGWLKQKPPVQSDQEEAKDQGRKTAAQKLKEEAEKNRRDFLSEDTKTQNEMLFDADWNLYVRYDTTQHSLVYSGLLFMGDCSLLGDLFGSIPRLPRAFFIVSLVLLLLGGLYALSELFRRQPTELQRTRQLREQRQTEEPKPSSEAEIIRYDNLRSGRYAQMKNRVTHVQRNTFRLRWFTTLAALAFIGGLVQLF